MISDADRQRDFDGVSLIFGKSAVPQIASHRESVMIGVLCSFDIDSFDWWSPHSLCSQRREGEYLSPRSHPILENHSGPLGAGPFDTMMWMERRVLNVS